MKEDAVARDLESALRERARRLADEHLAHAREIHEQIIQEENERLRLREEREVLAAKELAERLYRRRVQAEELKLREQLERRRWELIQAVMKRLDERLHALADDEDEYFPVLQHLLREAAAVIPEGDVITQLNAQDLERLKSRWKDVAAEALPGRTVELQSEPHHGAGGVRVHDRDNHVRLDNTFEARVERLSDTLYQVISARLFGEEAAAEGPHGG